MPILNNPLTRADYVRFNDTMMRIRALEYMATTRFLRGNSDQRTDIARTIRDGVATLQSSLRTINVAEVALATPSLVPGRCNFPYCPSPGGTCELCGFAEIQQQLLTA
jgi:hypothetical protein